MIKVLLLVCFCFFANQSVNGQKIDTVSNNVPLASHDMFMQKYKANKRVGWIMFGSGMAMASTGFYIYLIHELESDTRGETEAGPVLFYLGSATALLSIPFFLSAGQYKRQAKLALSAESLSIGGRTLCNSNYTTLTLTIPLSQYKKDVR